jgi:16S rRNA (cytosine1402-N4)-methyltransferase
LDSRGYIGGLNESIKHLPVMLEDVIEMLNLRIGGVYVDATIGLGGHSERILELIGTEGQLIGIDRDEDALKITAERLKGRKVILKMGSFSDIEKLLNSESIHEVDGILFDLGVSTLQLKNPEKGFSFSSDRRLDMRMDRRQSLSAWDVVNRYPENRIERIIKEFGEESSSRKIAKAIINSRDKKKINTCSELSEIIEGVSRRRGKIHPATKTFQALRIEVNNELGQLRAGLDASLRLLRRGGRLCVISYHSLEDREVKRFIVDSSKQGLLRRITKKPKMPGSDEIRRNPASRSAKLRAAEKI